MELEEYMAQQTVQNCPNSWLGKGNILAGVANFNKLPLSPGKVGDTW